MPKKHSRTAANHEAGPSSTPKPKHSSHSSEDSGSDSDSSSSSSSLSVIDLYHIDSAEEKIDVQFEIFDISSKDEYSARHLLKRLCRSVTGTKMGWMEMVAETICSEDRMLGSVVKSTSLELYQPSTAGKDKGEAKDEGKENKEEEVDESLGLIAIMPLEADTQVSGPFYKQLASFSADKNAVEALSKSNETISELIQSWKSNSSCSILVMERFINLPVQLVPSMLQTLENEMVASTDKESKHKTTLPKYMVYFSQVFDTSSPGHSSKKSNRRKNKRKKQTPESLQPDNPRVVYFPKAEDEAFYQNSDFIIQWPRARGAGDDDYGHGFDLSNIALVFKTSMMSKIIKDMEKMIAS